MKDLDQSLGQDILHSLSDSKFPEISHFYNRHDCSLGRRVNAASRKGVEIQT